MRSWRRCSRRTWTRATTPARRSAPRSVKSSTGRRRKGFNRSRRRTWRRCFAAVSSRQRRSRDSDAFLPHVTTAVRNVAAVDDTVRKDRKNTEERFARGYPFHPDLTDLFYTRWTQLDRFQRTRGILRTFAIALRDAARWDQSPLVGPNVFLPAPDRGRYCRGGPRADRRRYARDYREPGTRLGGDPGG